MDRTKEEGGGRACKFRVDLFLFTAKRTGGFVDIVGALDCTWTGHVVPMPLTGEAFCIKITNGAE
jgi:hypothetical protein